MVTINLEPTTSTMVDKELTTHRQFTVDNWSTMVDKVDKLSTRSTRSTNRAQVDPGAGGHGHGLKKIRCKTG